MIYSTFMQYSYMKHRMQITQKRWEYDLTTNSVKKFNKRLLCFQKVTVVFVTNIYCSTPTW